MSSRLAAAVEKSMTEDAESSSGWVLPAPLNSDLDPEDEDNPIVKLIKDLRSLKGKTALVPTTATGWGSGRAEAPLADWRPQRIGFSPEPGQIDLRAQAVQAMFNTFGVPLGLAGEGDATSTRESLRLFGATVLSPLARILAGEIGEKLDVPDLQFSFGELLSADIVSRSRAFGSIAGALSGSIEQGQAADYDAERVGFLPIGGMED